MSRHIAIDLGAESGRVIVADVAGDRITLHEAHRFANAAVQVGPSLYWDVLHLWQEIKTGLRQVVSDYGRSFDSLAVDTWGIDFALLDHAGNLVGNPHTYRDARTTGMLEAALARVPQWSIYEQSAGIQFMSINTLYQMLALAESRDPGLGAAARFLMLPDLFNFWLCGSQAGEFTNATTTQFYHGPRGAWALGLLDRLGIRTDLFPEVVLPGSQLGMLRPEVAAETGLDALPVVAVASHDTASAIVAVPAATGSQWAWLSSGTWSLLGGVSDRPLVTPQALGYNFSSYGGPDGMYLPWKNIMGLWLLQECRRSWERAGAALTYDDLTALAQTAPAFGALVDPDDPSFLAPRDMPAAIAAYCTATGQAAPDGRGEMARSVLESLALRYRQTLEHLAELQGARFDVLHVVGGGSRNALLNQFTADATGLTLIAGPSEATALGNAALQAVATGALGRLSDARTLIRAGSDVTIYLPGDRGPWDAAYERFRRLTATAR